MTCPEILCKGLQGGLWELVVQIELAQGKGAYKGRM